MVTPIGFLRETIEELKKVVFPKKEEAIRLAFTVVIVSAIVGYFIGGVDLVLTKILELLIR